MPRQKKYHRKKSRLKPGSRIVAHIDGNRFEWEVKEGAVFEWKVPVDNEATKTIESR